MKHYRYRKLKPEDVKKMKELRKNGVSVVRLAKMFNVGTSTIQYHTSKNQKEQNRARAMRSYRKMTKKERREKSQKAQPYKSAYMRERYQEDSEFRQRMIDTMVRSEKRKRDARSKKGLCPECGGKREDKEFKWCMKCRNLRKIELKKRVERRNREGLCARCRVPLEDKKFKTCLKCRSKARTLSEVKVRTWNKQGLCPECGRKRKDKQYAQCEICRERGKKYYDKHKQSR